MKKLMAVIAVLFLVFAGCESKGKQVASVNGSVITEEALNDEISNLPNNMKMYANSPQMKKRILDNLVTVEVLIQEAEKEGLLSDPKIKEAIKAKEAGIRAQADSQIYMLKKQKEQAARIAKREVVLNELLGKKDFASFPVKEKEIMASYSQYTASVKANDPKAKPKKLSEIKGEIKKSIARQNWISDLKKKAKIDIDEKAVGGSPLMSPANTGGAAAGK